MGQSEGLRTCTGVFVGKVTGEGDILRDILTHEGRIARAFTNMPGGFCAYTVHLVLGGWALLDGLNFLREEACSVIIGFGANMEPKVTLMI